jgi:hypothetical protein
VNGGLVATKSGQSAAATGRKRPIGLPIPDIPHETGAASVKVAC